MGLENIVVSIFVMALVIMGAIAAFRQANQGARDIARLKTAGSNLSKPHLFELYLRCPTRDGAERAANKIRATGCGIKSIGPAASGPGWMILATKTMVPTEAELTRLRKEFENFAKTEKGEYDGWEAQGLE